MSLCDCRGRFANGKEMARRRSVSREPQAMLACESLIQRRAASRDIDAAIHKPHRQSCRRINQRFLKRAGFRKTVRVCYSMDLCACGFETRASPSMARAQRITLRPWLAFCGALQVDKSSQSASPCGRASWTFIVTASPRRRISSHGIT